MKRNHISLVRLVDSLRNSIGYDLLSKYRNWAEHRGAPRFSTDIDFQNPIPIPEEVLSTNNGDPKAKVKNYLSREIPDSIRIYCYPFVPPVHTRLNQTEDKRENGLSSSNGIEISNSKTLMMRGTAYSEGSLFEDAKEYRRKNSHNLDKNRKKFAGEKLAEYSYWDYALGMQKAMMFALSFINSKLDMELHNIITTQPD